MNSPEANQNRKVCEKLFGINHMTPARPILTVSHIMNSESNAHCQDNQGYKGDEANNPRLETSSLPGPHHRRPEKESKWMDYITVHTTLSP